MELTPDQISEYRTSGYLFFPGLLSGEEIGVLRDTVPALMARPGPEVRRDRPGGPPKIVYAPHAHSDPFGIVTRLPRVLGPVRQLLREDVYVYQSRINLKHPFAGDAWSWHQDFSAWHRGDGMPRPHAMMTAVFLHDCTPANGPLLVIPQSQRDDVAEILGREADVEGYGVQRITTEVMKVLAEAGGIVDLAGPAGSVAFIHPTVVHGSAPNMTPWSRSIYYINFNAVSNRPDQTGRAWYMNNPDTTPLEPVDDKALLMCATVPAH